MLTLPGLNKLSGFKLLNMSLTKAQSDGTNSEGRVLIPNPSVITISMVRKIIGCPNN